MNKPGIIDPWRQDPPKPVAAPKGRIEEPTPDEGEPQLRCISFEAPRCGINVWVDATLEDPQKWALMRLQALLSALHGLHEPAVTKALHARGIIGPATSAHRTEDVAPALRQALLVSTKAAALIARHKVKAFVR